MQATWPGITDPEARARGWSLVVACDPSCCRERRVGADQPRFQSERGSFIKGAGRGGGWRVAVGHALMAMRAGSILHVNLCLKLLEHESFYYLELHMLAVAGEFYSRFLIKSPGDNILID